MSKSTKNVRHIHGKKYICSVVGDKNGYNFLLSYNTTLPFLLPRSKVYFPIS